MNGINNNDEDIYKTKQRKTNYEMKINIFKNEKDMKDYYILNYELFEHKNVKIYGFNFESLTDYTMNYRDEKGEIYDNLINAEYNNYLFQYIIENTIIKTLVGSSNYKDFKVYEFLMEKKEETKYEKNISFKEYINYFLIISFLPCMCSLLNNLIIEKESKIKESLIIIGLKKSVFWVSWAIVYSIIIILNTTIVVIALVKIGFYEYTNWLAIYIPLVLYGFSCCFLSFLLSTLIKKSKTANIIYIMIIITYFFTVALDLFLGNKYSTKAGLSFISSPNAFLAYFNFLMKFEIQNIHLNFSDVLRLPYIKHNLFGLIFCTFLYLIIAIYLDNVIPQGNNFHRKWNFLITDLIDHFKNKNKNSDDKYDKLNSKKASSNDNNPYIQEDPQGMKKAVEVKNIAKTYISRKERIEVLRNIEFNAYYDEIFAILGHNGAGKTTLINIMTGIISSTSGEVYYDGTPITGNETEICKQFGYCPQFETFNNNLTIGEHIKLFAGIKGIKVDVNDTLRDIDLLKKKNNFPKELSGGQRRKLCISLSLLGSPKYIFLDEPTTGLDPFSRKNIWDYLMRCKKDKVMFITTHYMDEADLLADRKMITSNGVINCLGSSLFLKNSFNMSYSLDIHIEEEKDCSIVDSVIDNYCPGSSQSKVITNSNLRVHEDQDSNENNDLIVTYLMPIKYSTSFKDIFRELSNLIQDDSNTIKNFSLTAPTLEELFIKLENNNGNANELSQVKNTVVVNMENMNTDNDKSDLEKKLDLILNNKNTYQPKPLTQIVSIMKIRLKLFIRNKTFAIFFTFLPTILELISILVKSQFINQTESITEYTSVNINPNIYNNYDMFIAFNSTTPSDITNVLKNIESEIGKKLLTYSNGFNVKNNDIMGGISGVKNDKDTMEFIIHYNTKYSLFKHISINLLSNSILKNVYNIDKNINAWLKPLLKYNDEAIVEKENEIYEDGYEDEWYSQLYGFENNKEIEKNEKEDEDEGEGEGVVKGISDIDYFSNIYDDSKEATLIHELITVILVTTTLSLSLSNYAPLVVKEKEEGIIHQIRLNKTKKLYYWIGIFIGDFICLLISVIPITIIGIISGMNIYSGRYIFYIIICTLLWIANSLLCQYIYSFFFKKYEKISNILVMLYPVLSLICSVFIIVYLMGLDESIFDEKGNKRSSYNRLIGDGFVKSYYILFIIILYSPSILVYAYGKLCFIIMNRILSEDNDEVEDFLSSEISQKILSRTDISRREKKTLLTEKLYDYKMPTLSELLTEDIPINLLMVLIVLFSTLALYIFVINILEKLFVKVIRRDKPYVEGERENFDKKLKEGPKDVYNEWKKVDQEIKGENTSNTIAIKAYNLIKEFPLKSEDLKRLKKKEANKGKNDQYSNYNNSQKENENRHNSKGVFEKMDDRILYDEIFLNYVNRIVRDVTFGVNAGECLGLLGPNGAGKTTCIAMMTGTLNHTHGTIFYGNNNLVESDYSDLSLGYCAQNNSLWNLLTVNETIQLYLSISGYPKEEVPKYTKYLIEACGIENHANKRVGRISGGTKRKLSLIIAICSSPGYLILDEPSAGMDPFTRRYMWKIIKALKKVRETATLLTTHSTEEAEALCERIAILIKGSLICIDTPKSIKMNHSSYYTLEVFTDDPETFENEYVKNQNIFGLDNLKENSTEQKKNNDSSSSTKSNGYEVQSYSNYQKYSVEMKNEKIANVFSLMEIAKASGLVNQYNFGQYSLEQVFINFINNS